MSVTRSWTLGADPSCDIVVNQDYVSGRHCRLNQTVSGFVLEDLGSTNGTWVNGSRIWSPHPITPQDNVTLGKLTPLPWPPAALAPTAPGPNSVAQVLTVGRGPENDVVLDYATVSTRHARIQIDGTSTTIEDLGSTNGTFLNSLENRITRSSLNANDTVYFGTQPIPASRLLGSSGPAAKATVAINPAQIAALAAAGAARPAPASPPPPAAPRPVVPPTRTPADRQPDAPVAEAGGMPMGMFWGGGIVIAVLVAVVVGLSMSRGDSSKVPGEKVAGGGSANGGSDQGENAGDDGKTAGGSPASAGTSAAATKADAAKAVFAVLGQRTVPAAEGAGGPAASKVVGQLGTAAAVGPRVLITSAEVAAQVQRQMDDSWEITVYSPTFRRDFRVVRATTHPEYQRAFAEGAAIEAELIAHQRKLGVGASEEGAEPPKGNGAPNRAAPGPASKPADDLPKEASSGGGGDGASPPAEEAPLSQEETEQVLAKVYQLEDRLLESFELQSHFDVGILEVDADLPARIGVIAPGATVEGGSKVRVLGLPHSRAEKEIKRAEITAHSELGTGRYRQRGALVTSGSVKTQDLVLLSSPVGENDNWAGSLVLDGENRLVAVLSRVTPPLKAGESPKRDSVEVVPRSVWAAIAPPGTLPD